MHTGNRNFPRGSFAYVCHVRRSLLWLLYCIIHQTKDYWARWQFNCLVDYPLADLVMLKSILIWLKSTNLAVFHVQFNKHIRVYAYYVHMYLHMTMLENKLRCPLIGHQRWFRNLVFNWRILFEYSQAEKKMCFVWFYVWLKQPLHQQLYTNRSLIKCVLRVLDCKCFFFFTLEFTSI